MAETDVVLITHQCVEHDMQAAIARIEKLSTVLTQAVMLRMEAFV
jgi:homoserine dehydrogenase